MKISTSSIPRESLADLMRSLDAALTDFRRMPGFEQRVKDYHRRQERTKTQWNK